MGSKRRTTWARPTARRIAGDEAENEETALDLFLRARRGDRSAASRPSAGRTSHARGRRQPPTRHGDRAENIELAIEYLTESLRYLDPRLAPGGLADQSSDAGCLVRLPVWRAIEVPTSTVPSNISRRAGHRRALRRPVGVGDAPAEPGRRLLKRAQTGSPNGDRREDSRRAREALENVLSVRTREADPAGLGQGDRDDGAAGSGGTPSAAGSGRNPRACSLVLPEAPRRRIRSPGEQGRDPAFHRARCTTGRPTGGLGPQPRSAGGCAERARGGRRPGPALGGARQPFSRTSLEVHTPTATRVSVLGSALRHGHALAALDRWADAADAFRLSVDAAASQYPDALTSHPSRTRDLPVSGTPVLDLSRQGGLIRGEMEPPGPCSGDTWNATTDGSTNSSGIIRNCTASTAMRPNACAASRTPSIRPATPAKY